MKSSSWEIAPGLSTESMVNSLQPFGTRLAIISDQIVSDLYGNDLKEKLLRNGFEVLLLTFPPGENYKTRSTKERLEDALLENGFGRDTSIIALGGGVVTDLAGFVAATYCRGVPLFLIPTSLLAMVDACIGGKTGVNVPAGKNMIGSFYHPQKIWIDLEFLQTLSLRELKNGIVEMIKHALIIDKNYFDFLENHSSHLLALENPYLERAIVKSILIKEKITTHDEKESGLRFLLNFGHTVGHALEVTSHFKMSHGEAVAIGIAAESYLSLQMGYLSQESFDRILEIFAKYKIPLEIPPLNPEDLCQAIRLDKKSLKATPRFTLLSGIGECYVEGNSYCMTLEKSLLKQMLDWCHALCRN